MRMLNNLNFEKSSYRLKATVGLYIGSIFGHELRKIYQAMMAIGRYKRKSIAFAQISAKN